MDSNLDHSPHGRGGLSLDLNPVCLRVNAARDIQYYVTGIGNDIEIPMAI